MSRKIGGLIVLAIIVCAAAGVYMFRNDPREKYVSAGIPPGLENDYCEADLRASVEQLKTDASNTPTNDKSFKERSAVLWQWANARALAGYRIPVELPLMMSISVRFSPETKTYGQDDPTFFDRVKRDVMFKFTRMLVYDHADLFIRDLTLREHDPSFFGTLTGKPLVFETGSYQTIEQTFTVGAKDIVTGGYLMIAQNESVAPVLLHGPYQAENPGAENFVTASSSNPSAKFKAVTKKKFGMHGGPRWPAQNLAFELTEGRLTKGDTVTITIGDRSGGSRGFRICTASNDEYQIPIYISFGNARKTFIGKVLGLGYDHMLDMVRFKAVGGVAASVQGFAPSIVKTGEPFDASVRLPHDPKR